MAKRISSIKSQKRNTAAFEKEARMVFTFPSRQRQPIRRVDYRIILNSLDKEELVELLMKEMWPKVKAAKNG